MNKDLKHDQEKRSRSSSNLGEYEEVLNHLLSAGCRKFAHLADGKDALTLGTNNLPIDDKFMTFKCQKHLEFYDWNLN